MQHVPLLTLIYLLSGCGWVCIAFSVTFCLIFTLADSYLLLRDVQNNRSQTVSYSRSWSRRPTLLFVHNNQCGVITFKAERMCDQQSATVWRSWNNETTTLLTQHLQAEESESAAGKAGDLGMQSGSVILKSGLVTSLVMATRYIYLIVKLSKRLLWFSVGFYKNNKCGIYCECSWRYWH